MASRPLTGPEFLAELAGYARDAFRLEVQPYYAAPDEQELFARFLAGEDVDPSTDPAGLGDWYAVVREVTGSGRTMRRVRVHGDPPTDWERYEQHTGRWNVLAGEDIRYLTRDRAHELGLPVDSLEESWLLDDNRLIVLTFDDGGRLVQIHLVDDADAVAEAARLREVAWGHGTPLADPSS